MFFAISQQHAIYDTTGKSSGYGHANIKDYINAINRDIMGSDNLTDLARKIYSNHKELLDFILESRPDLTLEVRDLLIQIIVRIFNLYFFAKLIILSILQLFWYSQF